ncbi:enoyl-CoA hydratase/isomerase family protein [Oceaniglobus indicus]|uniref:enoyl-CoA hydratase/isomerase family protein n=1 Tax=Oceaniglobus indicus TaxID=2047749 RepID=UPI000C1A7437|nr:enoyl-CoA hydratase/isomerase family protein [Oceaniglobus indicus]
MSAVHLDLDGPLAFVTLDNPGKLNAFTPDMLRQLEHHCAQIDATTGLRCVIVRAAPARAFCAGADINAWGDLAAAEFARHWVRGGHRVFDRLARLRLPTIAALDGGAFGGGLELAAACDIRVAAPNVSFALPEPKVGVVPGWSGTQRLARLLPEAVVKEMALFARPLDAARAHALGFVAEIAGDPAARAVEIAEAMLPTSPQATETVKYMLHAAVGEDRGAMIETLAGGMIAASADKAEGVAAFRAKRPPSFPEG